MSSSRAPRGQRPLNPDEPVPGRLGAGDAHFAAAAAAKPQSLAQPPSLVTPPAAPGNPNFTDFIRITSDQVVAGGTVSFADALPYMFTTDVSLPPWPTLTNNGTLWSRSSSPGFTPEAVVVWSWNFGVIHNNGLIVAQGSDNAQAILILGHFEGVVNAGSIYALADRYFATAIRDWDSGYAIVNSGLIAALSLRPDDGLIGSTTATGINRMNGGPVVNMETGRILAEGSAAVGLALHHGHRLPFWSAPYNDLENRGLIEARSLDAPKPSIAVLLESIDSEDMTVRNSGTIRSDIAIVANAYGSGPEGEKRIANLAGGLIEGAILLSHFHEKLINHGRIEGDIDMADGSDLVLNFGTIVGRIDLGGGADIWRMLAGILDGAVYGGAGGDSLTGSAGVERLNGEAGTDVIRGGGGADLLDGGADADIFVYGAVSDSTAAAFDTIAGFVSGSDRIDLSALAVQSVSIEAGAGFNVLRVFTAGGALVVRVGGALTQADLILSNIAAVAGTANVDVLHATAGGSTLTGGSGDDTLIGAAGNDRLDGGAGADTLMGGGGDDVYTVDFSNGAADLIWEFEGEGSDTIEVYLHDYFYLPENVENVVAFDPEYTYIYGNALGNRMTGNAVINTFLGGAGNDVIDGGDGADRLQGDSGGDRLTGGAGADMFIYSLASDSMERAPRSDGAKRLPDFITDFSQGEDKIDLSAIPAEDGRAFPETLVFSFIGTNAFSGHAGELRYEISGGLAHIYGDTDGNGVADLHILTNAVPFAASDFIL